MRLSERGKDRAAWSVFALALLSVVLIGLAGVYMALVGATGWLTPALPVGLRGMRFIG
jgi:hypothetical protein